MLKKLTLTILKAIPNVKIKNFVRLTALMLALAVGLSACGGLAGEPAIVRTSTIPTSTPTPPPDIGKPSARIDLQRGAEIFTGAQGCQACHGLNGAGNGAVAVNFTCPLLAFSDPQNASKSVTAWFAVVANGNGGTQNCLMPPWKNVFNEQDRWNVTNYVYSLRYSQAILDQGKQLYATSCASCHGADGSSIKDSAGNSMPSLADSATLLKQSDTALIKLLSGTEMPHPFKDTFTDAQRAAVVAYTRSLGWDHTEIIGSSIALGTPQPTPTATVTPTPVPDAATINVMGTLSIGTKGSAIPSNRPLSLRLVERTSAGFSDAGKFDTVTDSAGKFTFGEVPRKNGLVYIVSTEYAGILQTSNPVLLQSGSGNKLDASFTIFETTDDVSLLKIDAQSILVDFAGPQTAVIQQGLRIVNTGDKLYTPPLAFTLPQGATQVQLSQESASRFRATEDGTTTLTGIAGLQPGVPATLQFTYQLPFTDSVEVSQPTRYLVDQLSVHVLLASGGTVTTVGYAPDQQLELQTGTYSSYAYTRTIAVGGKVEFTIQFPNQIESSRRAVLTAVLLAAVALIGGMGLIVWRMSVRKRR